MTLWTKIFPRRDEVKTSATAGLDYPGFHGSVVQTGGHLRGQGGRAEAGRAPSLVDGYGGNAVVHRCVKMIAQGAASVPFLLHQDERLREEHPLLDLLARPNPTQGGAGLWEAVYSHFLLHGNAYLEQVAGADVTPQELYALRPDRMSVVPGPHGWPQALVYAVGGRQQRFPLDPLTGQGQVLQIKAFHPGDDHYGLSPLAVAGRAIALHNSAGQWNKALLDQGARPSGALVFAPRDGQSGQLTDEQFQRLKAQMEENFQGANNAGRPLLLEGGLNWQAMAFSPAEMDFLEGRHAAARDIATAFGVPPMLLSIPGDNTYSNYQEAQRALWRQTILPLMETLCAALNMWLCPRFGDGLRLTYDRDAIPALATDRQALWARVGAADFLTEDEKRAAVGLPPRAK